MKTTRIKKTRRQLETFCSLREVTGPRWMAEKRTGCPTEGATVASGRNILDFLNLNQMPFFSFFFQILL